MNKILQVLSNKLLLIIIIVLGILLRMMEWLHCRDLMMDEVNVARNIYERGYDRLFSTLDYEQFAPPLFLCAIKSFTLIGGFGELTLRFFPLICSFLALIFFSKLLFRNGAKYGAWYVLALFSFSLIYIQYANFLKQYSSDALITIMLLYCAFHFIKNPISNKRFFIFWSILGSIVIWLSMPSVFILSGIGISFIVLFIRQKQHDKIKMILGVGIIWFIVFVAYYLLILHKQVGSEYLKAFHTPYYLNVHKLKDIFGNAANNQLLTKLFSDAIGTNTTIFLVFNLILFVVGIVSIFKDKLEYGLLIILPIVALLVASALQQFTMLTRVCIFIMPIILFCIGYGFSQAMLRLKLYSIPLMIIGILSVYNAQNFKLINKKKRTEIDELTTMVNFAVAKQVAYNNIFVPALYTPCVEYYSNIHPNKQRGRLYKQLQIMNEPYYIMREKIERRAAFVYFWIDDATLQQHNDSLFQFLKPLDAMVKPSYKVYVYENVEQ